MRIDAAERDCWYILTLLWSVGRRTSFVFSIFFPYSPFYERERYKKKRSGSGSTLRFLSCIGIRLDSYSRGSFGLSMRLCAANLRVFLCFGWGGVMRLSFQSNEKQVADMPSISKTKPHPSRLNSAAKYSTFASIRKHHTTHNLLE